MSRLIVALLLLLALQIHSRRYAADPPGRVQARGQGRQQRKHDCREDAARVEMRQLLVPPCVRRGVHCAGGDIQGMNAPEAECPETQAEYSSRSRQDSYLD